MRPRSILGCCLRKIVGQFFVILLFFFYCDFEKSAHLEDLAKQMSRKCKGLPLAAKTLGSLMHFKKGRDQWISVLNSSL